MIPQMKPIFGEEESQAVYDYMQSGGWVTEYKKAEELECILAEYLNIKHVIMMSSGTMALYAALMVLGIGPGDHVLVPGMTMIATANAVKMTGAFVTFGDIDPDTLCLKVGGRVTDRTKAVIYVSLNGRRGNMGKVREYCRTSNLWLVEDAAQSLGSTYYGKPLGTFGDIGCFSLSCQKIISTGNGGFCVTNNDDLAYKLRLFKNFGRAGGGTDEYLSFGTNLKFTDLQATIGIEQMKRLRGRLKRKREMWRRYYGHLSGISGIELIPTSSDTVPWFFDVLVNDRECLMAYLKDVGIGTRRFYPAIHQTPVYCRHTSLPITEDIAQRGLWLPSSIDLTDDEIDFICEKVEEFYG